MRIDVILQYCVFVDYPLWRAWLAKHRDKFNKVILYPSRHHGVIDLEEFSKKVIPETWVEPVPINYGIEDWRQAETTPCMAVSDSEWIFFTEQDFFCKDWDKFFNDIGQAMKDSADMIGFWNDTEFPYLHPCCIFMKRELFERTNKDFSSHPEIPGCDHFAMLTRDAERLGAKIVTLQDLGYVVWEDMFHLGGLTYPYQNWVGDGTDKFGVQSPEAFYVANFWARKAPVEQSPEFTKLSLEIEDVLKKQFPELDLENNKWIPFFKTWS